jgi:hypothetical protein
LKAGRNARLANADHGDGMKRGFLLAVGFAVLAALAADAFAAPKKSIPKKPPRPDAAERAMLKTTFVTYDVGTLRMTGKTVADASYRIGTLRLTGRSGAATVYSVGTLTMNGLREQ